MTLLWALQNLSSLPDPTKPVWDQDPKMLEILMLVETEMKQQEGPK
jgi:hypothetical protein